MEEIKSEFQVRVVRIETITKHPNADTLSLVDVEGYPVIIKTGSFQEGDLAVYVPVDALVPVSRPEFAFLKTSRSDGRARIKAAKLRGIFSMGLLVSLLQRSDFGFRYWEIQDMLGVVQPVREGENVQDALGIAKWIPPSERMLERWQPARVPKKDRIKLPVYGLDPFRKYKDVIQDGEEVVVTEKIHGCNARFCYTRGRLWVGSHRAMRGATQHRFFEFLERLKLKVWDLFGKGHRADLVRDAGDVWWETARAYSLKEKLAKKPNFVLYGEIYGERVQDLTYDSPKGRRFRAFDVYDLEAKRFLDHDEFEAFIASIGLDLTDDVVPVLYVGPWSADKARLFKEVADNGGTNLLVSRKDGNLISPHLIEGVVIKPTVERLDPRVGRVALKLVGEGYLLRKEAA